MSESFITIKNLGKVEIEYTMIDAELNESNNDIEPDKPVLSPPRVIYFYLIVDLANNFGFKSWQSRVY